jgi:crossover junction endodeoxyribonuclease RuvC
MSTPTRPELVLAIDPGYERMGIALMKRGKGSEEVVFSACARTSKDLPLPERIGLLASELEGLIKKHAPDAVAIEKVYWSKSRSTALGVAEVRGMLETLASQHSLPVFQYSPQEVKLAVTGYGASDKRAVAMMLPKLVKMGEGKKLDDEMDAIAIGITCLASTRLT